MFTAVVALFTYILQAYRGYMYELRLFYSMVFMECIMLISMVYAHEFTSLFEIYITLRSHIYF